MTVFLDPREGSAHLRQYLQHTKVPVQMEQLPYGDAAFIGRGAKGAPVFVGIEVKRLSDFIQCMDDGRFVTNQLPGLLERYDIVWLIIEGTWTASKGTWYLEWMRGRTWKLFGYGRRVYTYTEVIKHLFSITQLGGIWSDRTNTPEETGAWIAANYRWWTNKDLDEHKSHLLVGSKSTIGRYRDKVLLVPSEERALDLRVKQFAAILPSIGESKREDVVAHFESINAMAACLDPREWAKIPRIGADGARKIVAQLMHKVKRRKQ